MRYLSLFSGIEAASVAWQPLGWTCVAVAEIEPFPAAVLAHHYPDVPNLGDVTAITDEQIAALGQIDVVVGGSPCQDLSVAGKRAGLAGERSGLFHEQLRIFHAARHLCGARFLVWENVPGAFSSNRGRDFAVVVGAMAGCRVDVPDDGWGTEGVALGEHGLVEWAVLDAQWFGVAQRRRRVFAVLDVGDWAGRSPILLEPDRLRGDSAPSREAGEGVATGTGACAAVSSGHGYWLDAGGCAATLRAQDSITKADTVITMAHGQGGAEIGFDRGPTLTCNHEAPIIAHAPAVSATLVGRSSRGGGQTNSPGHNADESLVVAHTLRGEGFDASEDGTGRGTPLVPVVCPTLRAGGNRTGGDRPPGTDVDTCESLIPVAVDVWNQSIDGDVAATLNAESGAPNHSGPKVMVPVQPYTLAIRGRGDSHDLEYRQDGTANALLTPNGGRGGIGVGAIAFDTTQITSAANRSNPQPGDACRPLAAGAHAPAIAFAHQAGGKQTTLGYDPELGTAPTLAKCQTPAVYAGMQVRRLVPTECEALQGFPRNYTRIPWRGKPARECPDGPRYKALGNSMAVPVMRWIGEQIQRAAA